VDKKLEGKKPRRCKRMGLTDEIKEGSPEEITARALENQTFSWFRHYLPIIRVLIIMEICLHYIIRHRF